MNSPHKSSANGSYLRVISGKIDEPKGRANADLGSHQKPMQRSPAMSQTTLFDRSPQRPECLTATERIRWVPGYEGDYAVSDSGRVFSCKGGSPVERKLQESPQGYRHIQAWKDGSGSKLYVHRAVLLAFRGSPADGHECRHLDGDPSNNSLANLKWGTRKENSQDRIKHSTQTKGASHPDARLTAKDVREIRDRHADGEPRELIAEDFPISEAHISTIVAGRSWAHTMTDDDWAHVDLHEGNTVSTAEVAERFDRKPGTVWLWIKKGRIPATKVRDQYRIPRDVIEQFDTAEELLAARGIGREGV